MVSQGGESKAARAPDPVEAGARNAKAPPLPRPGPVGGGASSAVEIVRDYWTTVTPRRFWAQAASFEPRTAGRSLP